MAEPNASIRTTTVLSNKFWICISNLHSNVTSEQLSKICSVPVENILMDIMRNKAWIINNYIHKDTAEMKARTLNGIRIHNQPIECFATQESVHIAKLCDYFRMGKCDFGDYCSKKHIKCKDYDTCSRNDCYCGHSQNRTPVRVIPIDNKDPAIEYYQIKITGLPMGTTETLLENKLGKNSKGRYIVLRNQTSTTGRDGTVAYLIGQPSEKMAQKFMKDWARMDYFPGFMIKYQLEIQYNVMQNAFDLINPTNPPFDTDEPVELSQDDLAGSQESAIADIFSELRLNSNALESRGSLELPKDLKEKHEWEYTGKVLGTTVSGQGEVYLIRRISKNNGLAALKVYKRNDGNIKRLRSYREMIALHMIKKESNGMTLNVPLLIDTNISKDFSKAIKDVNVPWIIISLAKGTTLTEFVKKNGRDIGFCEAINFCIKLVNITKSFHDCGVVHRDIKPDNIHVYCPDDTPLDEGDLTILDFGLAYIEQSQLQDDIDFDRKEEKRPENDFSTNAGWEIGNRWYRVPQLIGQSTAGLSEMQKKEIIQKRRSPSIDASNICAIFYWLLTKQIPGDKNAHRKEPPPHCHIIESNPTIWEDVIQKAIQTEKLKGNKERLKRYLLDIFDRGFADASHQWTIPQLLCHLSIMSNCFDKNTRINRQLSYPLSMLPPFCDQYSHAAYLFKSAKSHFVKEYSTVSTIYHWNMKNEFHWIDELATYQRMSIDLLHYYDDKRTMWAVEIYCLAKIDERMNINLFVGSIANGINIQLPICTLSPKHTVKVLKQADLLAKLQSPDNVKLQSLVNTTFAEELKTLVSEFHQKQIQ